MCFRLLVPVSPEPRQRRPYRARCIDEHTTVVRKAMPPVLWMDCTEAGGIPEVLPPDDCRSLHLAQFCSDSFSVELQSCRRARHRTTALGLSPSIDINSATVGKWPITKEELNKSILSLPRRREPSYIKSTDSRLRGNDDLISVSLNTNRLRQK